MRYLYIVNSATKDLYLQWVDINTSKACKIVRFKIICIPNWSGPYAFTYSHIPSEDDLRERLHYMLCMAFSRMFTSVLCHPVND
jgi:hypothetical protein